MENNYSEKRAAFTELYNMAVKPIVDQASEITQAIMSIDNYSAMGDDGVYALLGCLYRNPPTLGDVIDRPGIYTEENSGLTPEVCKMASLLLEREVTWNDPLVLQKIIAGDNVIHLSDAAFDKLTDMIENPAEPNQALIDLMKRSTSFKSIEDAVGEADVADTYPNTMQVKDVSVLERLAGDPDHKIQQSGIYGAIGRGLRAPTADFDGDTPDCLSFGAMIWTPAINEAWIDYVGRYVKTKRPGLSSHDAARRCYNNLSMTKKYNWKK